MTEKIFIDVRWIDRNNKSKIWESTFCSIADYSEFVNKPHVIELKHSTKKRIYKEEFN